MKNLRYYGLTLEEYSKCIPFLKESAQKMSSIVLGVSAAIASVLFIVSLFIQNLETIRYIYLGFAVFISFCCLIHIIYKDKWKIKEIYLVIALCLAFGVSLDCPYVNDEAAIFPILLITLPTLFTERFHNMVVFLSFYITFYLLSVYLYKSPSVWFWEIYDTLALTVVSLIVHWFLSRERCLGYLSMVRNEEIIIQLEKTQEELTYLSENDVLSGIANRRKLYMTMAQIENQEIPAPKGVMMLDLDDFKKYNDSYGHAAGDQCIRFLGTTLRGFEETNNIKFYRYGGEEFVGLFWCEDKEALNTMATDICVSVCSLNLDKASITTSIGTVICDGVEQNYEYWITLADEALYEAKRNGKNTYICWNDIKKE